MEQTILSMRWRVNQKGSTLVEVLVTTFILLIGIMGSLSYFAAATASTKLARDVTTATTHADYVLEDMQTRESLAEILNEDWTQWAADTGLNTLPDEVIHVDFEDPDLDPLNISATVTWNTNSRNHSLSLLTDITR